MSLLNEVSNMTFVETVKLMAGIVPGRSVSWAQLAHVGELLYECSPIHADPSEVAMRCGAINPHVGGIGVAIIAGVFATRVAWKGVDAMTRRTYRFILK